MQSSRQHIADSTEEEEFSGTLSLAHDMSDDVMIYLATFGRRRAKEDAKSCDICRKNDEKSVS